MVGATFSAGITAAAAELELETAEDICNDLARRSHLIRATGFQQFPDGTVSSRYQFVHALYRDVLYDRLGSARRARLHLRIGERLEALSSESLSDVASELADHFEQGSDWSRAIKYLRLAADASRRCLAKREAIAFLHRALAMVHRLPEGERARSEIALLETLATTYFVVLDNLHFDTALETYRTFGRSGRALPLHRRRSPRPDRASIPIVMGELAALPRRPRAGPPARRTPRGRAHARENSLELRFRAHLGWGWDPRAAEESREALAEIRQTGNRAIIAQHQADGAVIPWASSRYREALLGVVESLPTLADGCAENPYLVSAYEKGQMIAGWSLTLLGQFGMAIHETRAAIAVMEKNGDHYRAKTMQLFLAIVHLYALDFPGVLAICESIFPSVAHPNRSIDRRLGLALAGLAETALGSHASALERLSRAREEMDRYGVILSWWVRLMVEQGFTESLLATGDLGRARPQAERFLAITLATEERMRFRRSHGKRTPVSLWWSPILCARPIASAKPWPRSRASKSRWPLGACTPPPRSAPNARATGERRSATATSAVRRS